MGDTDKAVAEGDEDSAASGAVRIGVRKTYKIYVDGAFPRTESGRSFTFTSPGGDTAVSVCRCTAKDFREAVTAARKAAPNWSSATPYLRGQILYRIAELLEGRRDQFIGELQTQGATAEASRLEVDASVDRLVYYAGWADKYQQVFSSVNPVGESYFNFTVPEATGVVTLIAPESSALLGLVTHIAPAVIGGNTCIVLASRSRPLSAITLCEALHAADLPPGVVNVLTGFKAELVGPFSSHMDVNATVYCGEDHEDIKQVQLNAARNVKRVFVRKNIDLFSDEAQSPYYILDTQEFKTIWHPIGT